MCDTANFENLNKLKVAELKTELLKRDLDTRGVKAVLIERLQKALYAENKSEHLSDTTNYEDRIEYTPNNENIKENFNNEMNVLISNSNTSTENYKTEIGDSGFENYDLIEETEKRFEGFKNDDISQNKISAASKSNEILSSEFESDDNHLGCNELHSSLEIETVNTTFQTKLSNNNMLERSEIKKLLDLKEDFLKVISESETKTEILEKTNSTMEDAKLLVIDQMNTTNISDKIVLKNEITSEVLKNVNDINVQEDSKDLINDTLNIKTETGIDFLAHGMNSEKNELMMDVKNVTEMNLKNEIDEELPESVSGILEDSGTVVDETKILLDWYNSDLNLLISEKNFLTAEPLSDLGFGYMWAGARATFGFTKGKIYFEVKVLNYNDISHLDNEPDPHIVRVGFSTDDSSLQLGESLNSWGYSGSGKISTNCQFKEYGVAFQKNDINAVDDPLIISYAVNGNYLGTAFEISRKDLNEKAIFPHILTKNTSFEINFGDKSNFCQLPEEMQNYKFASEIPLEDRVRGTKGPLNQNDCEVIIKSCGKTFWADTHAKLHPEKKYNILGTNSLIDRMKVMGLSRRRNYAGRWDVLMDKCTKCLNVLLEMGSKRCRNYILDQTNVYPSAQRRKIKNFEYFKKKAIVIVLEDDEHKHRCQKKEREEGKDVPDSAILEMKAPDVDLFDSVEYVELPEKRAKEIIGKYNLEGKNMETMDSESRKRPRREVQRSSNHMKRYRDNRSWYHGSHFQESSRGYSGNLYYSSAHNNGYGSNWIHPSNERENYNRYNPTSNYLNPWIPKYTKDYNNLPACHQGGYWVSGVQPQRIYQQTDLYNANIQDSQGYNYRTSEWRCQPSYNQNWLSQNIRPKWSLGYQPYRRP